MAVFVAICVCVVTFTSTSVMATSPAHLSLAASDANAPRPTAPPGGDYAEYTVMDVGCEWRPIGRKEHVPRGVEVRLALDGSGVREARLPESECSDSSSGETSYTEGEVEGLMETLIRRMEAQAHQVEQTQLLEDALALVVAYVDGQWVVETERVLQALTRIEDLVHHVDNAVDMFYFHQGDGVGALVACAESARFPVEVRRMALWAIGTALQNNARAQSRALNSAIPQMMAAVVREITATPDSITKSTSPRSQLGQKAGYLFGALLRGNPEVQRAFFDSDIWQAVRDAAVVATQGEVHPRSMWGRIMDVLQDLPEEGSDAADVNATARDDFLRAFRRNTSS